MLNTDLHNPMIKKRMSLEEFIRNDRGINDGENLPDEYLTDIYNSLKENEIHLQPTITELQTATEWDRVLARSKQVAGPAFTFSVPGRRFTLKAGIHERDMFNIIADKSLSAITVYFN